MKTLQRRLKELDACADATDWVGEQSISEAWASCERGDWMLWLAAKLEVDRKLLVTAACDCAELSLVHVPEGEARPATAIATARKWVAGEATLEEVKIASAASYVASATYYARAAAYYASYRITAADASYTASASSAFASSASASAYYPASAAHYASAASVATLAKCADLVRKNITIKDLGI